MVNGVCNLSFIFFFSRLSFFLEGGGDGHSADSMPHSKLFSILKPDFSTLFCIYIHKLPNENYQLLTTETKLLCSCWTCNLTFCKYLIKFQIIVVFSKEVSQNRKIIKYQNPMVIFIFNLRKKQQQLSYSSNKHQSNITVIRLDKMMVAPFFVSCMVSSTNAYLVGKRILMGPEIHLVSAWCLSLHQLESNRLTECWPDAIY